MAAGMQGSGRSRAAASGRATLVREQARTAAQATRATEATRAARAARAAHPRPPDPPAAVLPVARVAVDLPLAHLDRPFDYLVTEAQSGAAVPGARVRVRFAGQELAGLVLERRVDSDHGGRLAPLSRVVSAEPVLSPQVARLARLVADRWAGTLADVLRLAVPPRHARVEKEPPGMPSAPILPAPDGASAWARYPGGEEYLRALSRGTAPRAVWTALPGPDWPGALAEAVRATLAGGRGALVVVPDARDVEQVDAALTTALGGGAHVALTAELGPAERYRRWLAVRRGLARAVVGTRAATYAPVTGLGLVAVWDDGDDLHAEPHAPYAHSRDVLMLRAHEEGTAALVAGHACTAEGAQLVATGWARPLAARRADVRLAAPTVRVAGADAEVARDPAAASARLPSLAWRTARTALSHGPVLVQVPRRGYVPVLACGTCREPARCPACGGPLGVPVADGQRPGQPREVSSGVACGWCGRPGAAWACPGCGSTRLRAVAVGSERTAEELGRAFPSVPVRVSGGRLSRVPDRPALVVATPGTEPVAAAGYAAALLLDGRALLSRPDLRAGEEALRRWLGAAALVRPAAAGGVVVVMAEAGQPAVQALLRWDPAGYAERELVERRELRLPPAARVATLTGEPAAVAALLAAARLPAGAEVLGPVPVPGADRDERVLVRVPRTAGAALAEALRAAQAVRTARKAASFVRIAIDPLQLG
jgi:primosomal protein N' (replication factor Y) (superfamily II helicase)